VSQTVPRRVRPGRRPPLYAVLPPVYPPGHFCPTGPYPGRRRSTTWANRPEQAQNPPVDRLRRPSAKPRMKSTNCSAARRARSRAWRLPGGVDLGPAFWSSASLTEPIGPDAEHRITVTAGDARGQPPSPRHAPGMA